MLGRGRPLLSFISLSQTIFQIDCRKDLLFLTLRAFPKILRGKARWPSSSYPSPCHLGVTDELLLPTINQSIYLFMSQ